MTLSTRHNRARDSHVPQRRAHSGGIAHEDLSRGGFAGGPAEGFRQTRAAHRSETAEDYVELIADLIDVRGEARAANCRSPRGHSGDRSQHGIPPAARWLDRAPPVPVDFPDRSRPRAGRDGAPAPPPGGRVPARAWAFGGDGRAGCRGDRAPCQRRDPQGLRPLRRRERQLVSQGQSVPISARHTELPVIPPCACCPWARQASDEWPAYRSTARVTPPHAMSPAPAARPIQ